MTLAALELNDQSLLAQAQDGSIYAEPGFARVTDEGVFTGEDARAVAWREPQHGYNQYWCYLNQTPLVAKQRWARHHGDIAFAQLRHVWMQAGAPDQLALLVPGSFSDAQLSLLLGMAAALPTEVVAIIDSALAACLDVQRPTLYVDMQLHQTVLSLCRHRDDQLLIEDQEVFPELGLLQVQNTVARHISQLLIESARYDPLHASHSEQGIYDRLPAWLTHLCWKPEVSATIDSAQGALPFILRRDTVQQLLSERLASMRSFCGRHAGCEVLLAHGSTLLAGLTELFADAQVAPQALVTGQALAQVGTLSEQAGLSRLRALKCATPVADHAERNGRLATHLLVGDRALPLHTPVSIRVDGDALHAANAIDERADLTVVLRRHRLETLRQAADTAARLPADCTPGQAIELAGHRLPLIEVGDG